MMKKMMLALTALALCGTASAATMIWGWDIDEAVAESTSFNMVVSDVRLSAAEAALAVDSSYTGPGVDGATAPTGGVTVLGSDDLWVLTGGDVGVTVTYTTAMGGTAIDFGADGKYVYLVLFEVQNGDNVAFAVASAGLVTADMVDDSGVNPPEATFGTLPGADPMEWTGGTYTAVMPEPIALALLALGVAGVALRRRVA